LSLKRSWPAKLPASVPQDSPFFVRLRELTKVLQNNAKPKSFLNFIQALQKITHIPQYSYSDYEKRDGNWERIDGYPFAISPSATGKHQFVAGEIFELIKDKYQTITEKEFDLNENCKMSLDFEGVWQLGFKINFNSITWENEADFAPEFLPEPN
jgi:hypothetical protein